ncbi:MAG: hypothetical protein ACC661_09450, partial [Verrucomicrobiales bacterium]
MLFKTLEKGCASRDSVTGRGGEPPVRLDFDRRRFKMVRTAFPDSRKPSVFLPLLAGLLALAGIPGNARAEANYREPDFVTEIFELDALSLPGDERRELVAALTAIACNFPGASSPVDNELREKALAIALRLDSMDPAARQANDSLIAGLPPPPLDIFPKREVVADALWRVATRLERDKAEPEDARLVPYLVDLALAVDPEGARRR